MFNDYSNYTEEAYRQALDWLFVQMPNYQTDGQAAYKPGLENIRKLCEFFGNPQAKLKTVHIGGTNGKGSVSNMLASVLQSAGYRTGLYNSPHLIEFTERIKVNGEQCSKEFVYGFIQKLKHLPEDIRPSFFEFTTVMAFQYFYEKKVDVAIIEVGLGGRLDATNLIHPMVCAITNVSLDHQNILGDTVADIAAEKAGIIKYRTPVISGEEDPAINQIFKTKAEEMGAPFINATRTTANFASDLKGHYQKKNIRTVLALLAELRVQGYKISEEHIRNGLLNVQKNTGFIGRWFEFSKNPLTICDTAHNAAGLQEVVAQLEEYPQKKHIILGFVKEKDIREVLAILPKDAQYYFTTPNIARGRAPEDYVDILEAAKINYSLHNTVQEAYLSAKQNINFNEMIFIGGSNFIVGEFLEKNLER